MRCISMVRFLALGMFAYLCGCGVSKDFVLETVREENARLRSEIIQQLDTLRASTHQAQRDIIELQQWRNRHQEELLAGKSDIKVLLEQTKELEQTVEVLREGIAQARKDLLLALEEERRMLSERVESMGIVIEELKGAAKREEGR